MDDTLIINGGKDKWVDVCELMINTRMDGRKKKNALIDFTNLELVSV